MTDPILRLSARARVESWLAIRTGTGIDGFCVVHRARGPAAADELHRVRFVETARRLNGLRHPVLERVEAVDADTPALVTAVQPAVTTAWLLDRMRSGGHEALPLPVAVFAVARAAGALAYAFDHGVRIDGLTAERLALGFEGTVHTTGLAAAVATAEAMAPPAAVIYGLGATLLELMTGDATRLPEPGTVPQPLVEVAQRALGGGASYAHPRAIEDALEDWLASDPTASRLDAKRLGGWVRKVAAKPHAAWEKVSAGGAELAPALGALLKPVARTAPPPEAPPVELVPTPAAAPEPVVPPDPAPSAPPAPVDPPGDATGAADDYRLLHDEDEDPLFVPQANLDGVLAPLRGEDATGDPGSAPVVEVVRSVGDAVVEVRVLHAGERWRPRPGPDVAMGPGGATLRLPADADGILRAHLGAERPIEGSAQLEPGDRAEVHHQGTVWRVRVDRAARAAGRATGVRLPWRLYLTTLGAALGAHVLLLLGLVGFADRLNLRVQRPDQAEVFASVQPPSKLPEAKPKPKPPTPRKKPPPRKVRKKQVVKADPTEAKPVIPERIRKKLDQRLASKRRKSKDAASSLLDTLNEQTSAGPGLDVKEVANAMDAVAGPSGGDLLEVASNLGDVPGADLKLGGGGTGAVDTKGGSEIAGKGAGKLKGRARSGRVRGKVKTVRALTKVGCDIDPGAVRAAVNARIGRIQGCYEKQLYRREGLSGKVTVDWGIDDKGRAKGVRVRVSTLGDPAVTSCVLGVIRKTRFPPVKSGECTISWPFVFSPVR